MAMSVTNKTLSIATPSALVPNIGSTQFNQIAGTGTGTSTSVAAPRWEYFDYTTTQGWIPATTQVVTGGIGDHQFAHQQYRALVWLKSLTGDVSATSSGPLCGPLITLEVATSTSGYVGTGTTGRSSNMVIIDSKVVYQTTATSTGNSQAIYLFGTVPTVGGAQYARVGIYQMTGMGNTAVSSTAFDVIIEGI